MPNEVIDDVSRETLEKYQALLIKWNQSINLIGKATIDEIRERHIMDCAQLEGYIGNKNSVILDLGSGAGLPGIVLNILGFANITLVEKDKRKGVFLEEARRILSLSYNVVTKRIEDISEKESDIDVITSRAFASLDVIFALTYKFNTNKTIRYLLLKGQTARDEITEAQKHWQFDFKLSPSMTNKDSYVLEVENLKRK